MNVVDSSAWVEYFFEGDNASNFAAAIEDTGQLLVPTICLFEVFKKVCLTAGESAGLKAVAHMQLGTVVDVSSPIALNAAQLSIRHKLLMADALIYSIGRLNDAVVWTQDEDFEGLPGVNYFAAPTA